MPQYHYEVPRTGVRVATEHPLWLVVLTLLNDLRQELGLPLLTVAMVEARMHAAAEERP